MDCDFCVKLKSRLCIGALREVTREETVEARWRRIGVEKEGCFPLTRSEEAAKELVLKKK